MIKDWPIYFKDRLVIGDLSSNVGVATLWMPKENVSSGLKTEDFAVCGQLYTKRGINPLIRNMLANPNIHYIVLCGFDRQGSGEALVKFFEKGFEEKIGESDEPIGWKIVDDTEALLDKQISRKALELLRNNVKLIDLRKRKVSEVVTEIKKLKTRKAKKPYSKALLFDEPEKLAVETYPSDISVFKIRRENIGDAWLDALKTVIRFGATIPGMYGNVKQVYNLSIVIEAEDPKEPKIEKYFPFDENGLAKYIEGFFDKEKGDEAYTYGERIFDWDGVNQFDTMVKKLKGFKSDRGAMAVLWKPHVDNFPPKATKVKKDGQTKGWRVPCLVMILGQCVNDKFNMTAIFRNNDIYGAWPLNAFALRQFQQNISKEIKCDIGVLTTVSHIAEIYEIDFDSAGKIVKDNDSLGRTCLYDPRGYYIVRVEGNDILLTFYSADGTVELASFRIDGMQPKAARDLSAMAIKDMLVSELGAACDLGRQLAKAENAVKLGLEFEQDNLLKFKKS